MATGGGTGVVGGGMLGLTLALRLAQSGRAVKVLEGAPELGGLAAPWRIGPLEWDRHYHVTLGSDAALIGLLRELGLEAELEWGAVPGGCYADGRMHRFSSALDFARLPFLPWHAKARIAALLFSASRRRDGTPLAGISAAAWTERACGRIGYERFWKPLLRAKLGDLAEDAAALFLWATIRRLHQARRAGLARERFGYVRGGYRRVIAELSQRLRALGVVLESGAAVRSVRRVGERLVVDRGPGAVAEEFDQVAVTTAAPIARELCVDLSFAEQQRLAQTRYLGLVCASLVLKRPLSGNYLVNIVDPGFPFTGVVEMTALVDAARHFGGATLAYLPRYVPAEDPLFAASDAAIEQSFLDGLFRMFPERSRADVAAFRVSRARRVSAVPTWARPLPPLPFATSVPGLFLASSANLTAATQNVNETVLLAGAAAQAMAAPPRGAGDHASGTVVGARR